MMEQRKSTAVTARLAVIGCGQWGRNLVRNFHSLGALAAVSDADAGKAAAFAQQYSVPHHTIDEILGEPGIDAVVLATPAETHAALTLRALDADKDVFVEKPLALRVDEAEQVKRRADANGRIVMVGHLLQYHPAFCKLKGLVTRGDLGRLQYIYSHRLNLGKIRREENVFWSFAPHDISMILSLTSEEPDSVVAVGHCYLHNYLFDVTTTHLKFPSGVNAHIFVSWLHPFKEQKFVVVGTEAMAVFDDGEPWASKVKTYRHKILWRNGAPLPQKAEGLDVPVVEREPLSLECEHFINCLITREKPRTDASEGISVLRVLESGQDNMNVNTGLALV